MSEPHVYLACRECAACHCHDCVMQEREVGRQAVQALVEERDKLREQVARLEAQLENARAANNLRQRRLDVAVQHWSAWEHAAASRLRQCDRLRAALEKYGQHQDECETSDWAVDMCCTCGLVEALKGAE